MDRHAVIDLLEHMAILLELNGENPFKIRAYQNGARALEGVEGELEEAVRSGALKQVKGIGAGLFADIKTLVETGQLPAYDALVAKTPPGLIEMLAIPGVGPKKVKAIHEGLGITTIGELEYACLENRLVDLPGFGAKTQAKILQSIETWKKNRGKSLYAEALPVAEALVAAIAALPAVERAEVAGALRRKAEIVEGIELVAESSAPEAAIAAVAGLALVEEALEATAEARIFKLKSGQLARVTVLPADRYGLGLLLATGSEAFIESLAARAESRGLSWPLAGAWPDEAAVFEALAMPVVPPELREGLGETAQAVRGALPTLVEDRDLQGVFHVHTRYSDGEATVRDMALKARQMGYRYIGISDHSEAAFYAHGLSRDRIAEQQAEIRALNEELEGIRILSGIEADILADGALDYDDETLATFDFVIGSVHSRFGQDRAAMTHRLVTALSHPKLTMLGHMTGRLLLSREPYDFDLEAVLQAAAAHGKIIELNANPHRLDIDWRDLQAARRLGIPIAINPDAHSPEGLDHTRFGVAVARKGGLAAGDVFNALPLDRVLAHLGRS